jgi:hypothetical protein
VRLRLKLDESIADLEKRAKKEPDWKKIVALLDDQRLVARPAALAGPAATADDIGVRPECIGI